MVEWFERVVEYGDEHLEVPVEEDIATGLDGRVDVRAGL